MRSQVFGGVFLCFLLVAGCGTKESKDAFSPIDRTERNAVTNASVSPEAERLVEQARALWQEDTCTEPEEAVSLLDRALALAPGYPTALALRGLARSELGQREQAFDDLTTALRNTPTAQIYAWRGLVSLRGGLPGAARRDAEYALRKEARQPDAWNVLGAVASAEGDNEQACKAFEKGCEGGRCRPLEDARRKGLCR